MSTPLVLGQVSKPLTVYLQPNRALTTGFTRRDGQAWAETFDLEISTARGVVIVTWPATITGSNVLWNRTALEVAAVIAANPSSASVIEHPASGLPFAAYTGPVVIKP